MIVNTVDDFDWERDMTRLSTLARQAEWEAYVSQFQGCSPDATSAQKWQLMQQIFDSEVLMATSVAVRKIANTRD